MALAGLGAALFAFLRGRKPGDTFGLTPSKTDDRETKNELAKIDQKHDEKVKETESHDTSTVAGGTALLRDYVEAEAGASKPPADNCKY